MNPDINMDGWIMLGTMIAVLGSFFLIAIVAMVQDIAQMVRDRRRRRS